ncbi:MAG TPA: glycoside hydrolase [Terracidiphilus sp.]|jgi:hypothetical protein|nr:glycoside hydrolase [Terracidiphilus sp.]
MLRAPLLALCICIAAGAMPVNAQRAKDALVQTDGNLKVNLAGVIGRSDIVLGRPNLDPLEAMPLGNGRLGAAVWSADGLTVQLNRGDTLPYRDATGQVVIAGLSALTGAKDYAGRLNLYDGEFEERGGGMTATVYVQPESDTLIVDVTGADPAKPQTAVLKLWAPREPEASVHGAVGMLAESWLDNQDPGASGRRFGSLAAITAEGRRVSATVTDARTVTATFFPDANGRFRVIVASPHYAGTDAQVADAALAGRDAGQHETWWHGFWHRADFIKVSSPDGVGEYLESLRTLYLFSAAAESGGEYPGSQAGVADLFSAVRDLHQWDPAAFWHWNLRMQVGANLGAGVAGLNAPYFRLYRENLANMETWTTQHMGGAPGACVPETMRFNGAGIEYEAGSHKTHQVSGWDCDLASTPYYNARTLSTGAEVSLWIWQQYLITGDRAFLKENYPVMAASARFLLSYEKPGADGLLHTSPSNAHETQWDTSDPTTDLAARRALYPAVIAAASLLNEDSGLIGQLKAAIPRIPPFPLIDPATPAALLPAGGAEDSASVIAMSYRPGDRIHNVENIGLEPVWPYDLIGDESPQLPLALRTFAARRNRANIDWCYDPVQAARLGLGSQVRDTLVKITEDNQRYINGFAKWGGNGQEFYVEQIANVALALQEALVQDYDGLIRVAPAIPPGWSFDGRVAARDGATVDVQVRNGVPTAVGIDAGAGQAIRIRNPWPGDEVKVIEMKSGTKSGTRLVKASRAAVIAFTASPGGRYRIQRTKDGSGDRFQPVDGQPATAVRRLGPVQIGLDPNP